MMPDLLHIHQLTTEVRIGVSGVERATRQPLWLDLELVIDAKRAARQDDVREAVDYAALVAGVKDLVEQASYHLLETLAEEVAAYVLGAFDPPEVVVRVTKRALPEIESAMVEVRRQRHSSRRIRTAGTSRRSARSPRLAPR